MDWITRLRILCMVPACNSHDKKNGYQEMRTEQGIPEAEEKTEVRFLDREDAKEIPIIAMTANAFTEDRIKAKAAGMDEHVAKPVDVELLIKVIHKLVG